MASKEQRTRTSRLPDIGADELARLIKREAAKQKVKIKLTPEQFDAIVAQWEYGDPTTPTEIAFYVGRKAVANLKVAGYWYRGDTCCV